MHSQSAFECLQRRIRKTKQESYFAVRNAPLIYHSGRYRGLAKETSEAKDSPERGATTATQP